MLGEVTEISGHGNGHRATTPLGDIDVEESLSGPLRLVFRPEQIVIDDDVRANGVITGIQFHGSDVVAAVRVGPDSVRARWPSVTAERIGSGGWSVMPTVSAPLGDPCWCEQIGATTDVSGVRSAAPGEISPETSRCRRDPPNARN